MSHITIKMMDVDPKKHVVKFETSDEDAVVKNIYISNDAAKELGVKKLADVKGIEITIRAITK